MMNEYLEVKYHQHCDPVRVISDNLSIPPRQVANTRFALHDVERRCFGHVRGGNSILTR